MYKPPSILSVSASPSWCEVQIFAFTGVGASLCLVGSGGAPFRSGGAPFRRLADLKHQGLGLAHWGVDGGPAWCKKDALRRVRTGRARAHASRTRAGTHVNADARASAHARTHAPARARTDARTRTHTHAVTFDALVTTPMTIETSHLREISYYRISGVHHSFFSPTSLSEARASITPQLFFTKIIKRNPPINVHETFCCPRRASTCDS